MRTLIFKHLDHAVMFKVLNDLPKKATVKYIDSTHSAIYLGGKIHKMNTKNLECESWIVTK